MKPPKIIFILLLLSASAWADPPAASTGTTTAPAVAVEPFVLEAARRLNVPTEDVAALRGKGFGKTEVLSFIAVAKAASKSWKDLALEREGGRPLRDLAKDAGLDDNKVFEASHVLRREIEKSLGAVPAAP